MVRAQFANRRDKRAGFFDAVAVVLVAVSTWREPTLIPQAGLDRSWWVGLHLAVGSDLRWGHDLVFAYGPLGFLVVPTLVSTLPALASVACRLALAGCIAFAIQRAWRRDVSPLVAWVVAAVTMQVLDVTPEVLALLPVGAIVALAASDTARVRWSRWLPIGVASAAAILTLVKVGLGLVGVASAFALALLVVTVPRWRALCEAAVAFVATLVVAWFLTGGRLGDLPTFLRGSFDILGGYAAAMSIEHADRGWEYLAAAAGIVAVVGLAWWQVRGRPKPLVLLGTLSAAVASWFMLRQGFVRHDGHSVVFFSSAAALVLILGPRGRPAIQVRASAAALLLVAGLVAGDVGLSALWSGPERIGRLVAVLGEFGDDQALADGRAEVIDDNAGVAPLLDQIEPGETVHIDPWEVSLVWAGQLDWQPISVLQRYAAYEPRLDEDLVERLLGADGPDVVIREGGAVIDSRFALWEAPRYELALLCNYRVEARSENWQLLRRREGSRCGEPVPIGSLSPDADGAYLLPQPADSFVAVRFECPASLVDRLLDVVFKPLDHPVVGIDGVDYRFIRAHAGALLPVRVDDFSADRITTIEGCGESPTLEAFAIPVSPP